MVCYCYYFVKLFYSFLICTKEVALFFAGKSFTTSPSLLGMVYYKISATIPVHAHVIVLRCTWGVTKMLQNVVCGFSVYKSLGAQIVKVV